MYAHKHTHTHTRTIAAQVYVGTFGGRAAFNRDQVKQTHTLTHACMHMLTHTHTHTRTTAGARRCT